MTAHRELRAGLVAKLEELESRMTRIRSDRRGEIAPPEKDSQEQAQQRENDEVLDRLDEVGRDELEEIRAAITRIDAGQYGACTRCGEAIPEARLRALPSTPLCVGCSE